MNGNLNTFEVLGGLGDIFTDLLGRKTERTDLGRKGGRGTDLTSGGTEVNDLLLVGVEFGSFFAISALAHRRGYDRASVKTEEPRIEEVILTHG